jgi:formate-dependent nitrite reductase membrane component NrfD
MDNEEWNHEVKSVSETLIKVLWIGVAVIGIIIPLIAYLLGK